MALGLLASRLPVSTVPSSHAGCTAGQGSFAFYYAPALTQEEIAWLQRFRLIVLGDILPPPQVAELKRQGGKLFFYHWQTGFYFDKRGAGQRRDTWESFVYHGPPAWRLNPEQPDPGPDEQNRSYYYDPAHPDLRRAWVKRLTDTMQDSTYEGVFFDLVGRFSVPKGLRQTYHDRHPDTPYDVEMTQMLRDIKAVHTDALLFTNQGYRLPQHYLPIADYDLSESLMTSYAWGEKMTVVVEGGSPVEVRETYYRPWSELRPVIDAIAADIQRYKPGMKMLHLNYVTPRYHPTGKTVTVHGTAYPVVEQELDRAGIYYGYAAAKLWDHESYSPASQALRFAQDEIYFADLGRPLTDTYEEREGLVWRLFDKGAVVVNPALEPRTGTLPSAGLPAGVTGLWDCYAQQATSGLAVTLEPTVSAASGRSYPAGRVYLYMPQASNR